MAGQQISTATLSRREGRRHGLTFAAYEEALGLSYGALRVPVDVMCRTFSDAPVDLAPYVPVDTLAEFTSACGGIESSVDRSGPDWLRFAAHHVHGRFGLPSYEMKTRVECLVDELRRSFGSAYDYRYEALSLLRCSDYGEVVFDAVREAVTEPGAQLLNDLMSAVSERPTGELLGWCGGLLTEESWPVVNSACLAIQNMQTVGGLAEGDWRVLVEPFTAACNNSAADPAHLRTLSTTLATLPSEVQNAIVTRVRVPLPPVRRPRGWSMDRRNRDFSYAEAMAAAVSTTNGDDEGMLAQLLFDLVFDYRATRSVTASFILRASTFAHNIQRVLARAAFDGPDRTTRHGATYALSSLMTPPAPDPRPWLDSPDPVHQGLGLEICAWDSIQLPADQLGRFLRGDDQLSRHALFAAGMSRHPALGVIAEDLALPEARRNAAAWWQGHTEGPVTT